MARMVLDVIVVGLMIYKIFLLVLEDIVYFPEVFCKTNGILSVLFVLCYTYMLPHIQKLGSASKATKERRIQL